MKKARLANRLQALREMAGLSQIDVHKKTLIDRARISLIENGHVEATPEELAAIMSCIRGAFAKQVEEFERIAGTEAA